MWSREEQQRGLGLYRSMLTSHRLQSMAGRAVPTRGKRSFLTWAMDMLCLFIFSSFIFTSVVSQPIPINGQASLDSAGATTYLPFILGPLPPAVYDPKRAANVTDLVDLAPSEAKRWGRGEIANVVYSPTADRLAVATKMGVWIYRLDDLDNGRLLAHTYDVNSVSWSPDGSQLASSSDDSIVRIWDVASGVEVSSLEHVGRTVRSVNWSPDGSQLASATVDFQREGGDVYIWDVATGEVVRKFNGYTWSFTSVSWSPDGTQVASGTDDGWVYIWNVLSGEEVITPQNNWYVNSVSWSPDGSQVASGSGEAIWIWDAASGAAVGRLNLSVNSVSWSPDGSQVASGSDDSTVRIWDVASGEEVSSLSGHTSGVNSVSWSPDGYQ